MYGVSHAATWLSCPETGWYRGHGDGRGVGCVWRDAGRVGMGVFIFIFLMRRVRGSGKDKVNSFFSGSSKDDEANAFFLR